MHIAVFVYMKKAACLHKYRYIGSYMYSFCQALIASRFDVWGHPLKHRIDFPLGNMGKLNQPVWVLGEYNSLFTIDEPSR